jgi:L-lactate dehydrogenase
MKIGIVGSGLVGATAGYAMVMRGVGREIVLVDKNTKRAQAEADDIFHAVPFAGQMRVSAGEYADLAGSRVVIIAAGVAQKTGESRLELLTRNKAVFADVVPNVLRAAPDALLLVASNPVDVMTHLAAQFAAQLGVPSKRVIGSGTTLDTARFRVLLGRHLGVDSQHVHAYVIGEHGDSEVLTWSSATVGGLPIMDFCCRVNTCCEPADREQIDDSVRRVAYRIIAGKGATYYGIGSALAQITNVILHDQRSILTVCTPMPEVEGIRDVTVSLPHLVGGEGILETLPCSLNPEEQKQLQRSAKIVGEAIHSL